MANPTTPAPTTTTSTSGRITHRPRSYPQEGSHPSKIRFYMKSHILINRAQVTLPTDVLVFFVAERRRNTTRIEGPQRVTQTASQKQRGTPPLRRDARCFRKNLSRKSAQPPSGMTLAGAGSSVPGPPKLAAGTGLLTVCGATGRVNPAVGSCERRDLPSKKAPCSIATV